MPFLRVILKIKYYFMNFFWVKNFFSEILISKMVVKMNLRIITKNYAVDPEIEFVTKSNLRPNGRTGPCRQRGSSLELKTFSGLLIYNNLETIGAKN